MSHKSMLLVVLSALVMSACSTAMMKPVDEGVSADHKAAMEEMRKLRKGESVPAPAENPVRRIDKDWLPVSRMEKIDQRASVPSLNRMITVNRRIFTANEAASFITSLTAVPISVNMPANNMQQGLAGAGMGGAGMGGAGMGGAGMGGAGMGGAGMAGAAVLAAQQLPPPFTYSGKLSGFLDLVAARYNLFWEWDGRSVNFFRTKSRTYRLSALPGDTSLTSKVGTQSATTGGGSSSSSSEQKAGVEFSGMSVWKAVEDSIRTMMTPDGRLTVTPATGTVTVDDIPVVLDRVQRFVDEQNVSLSRQVVINVKIYSVELDNSHQYGINWDVVYENMNRSLGFSLTNNFAPDPGATRLTFNVLPGSMWEGSSAMVDALSTQGKVSQVTSASMVTINNQPAPIQVAKQTSYLASSTTTVGVGGAGNTVALTPGQVTTGFSMNMLPHILNHEKLMLQYSGDISELTKLSTVTSGESSIQTPEIDTRNFMQRVIMNSGETLVVTGFEQFSLNGRTQGVGDAENVALGGGVKTSNRKSVLVVLIQPVLSGEKQ